VLACAAPLIRWGTQVSSDQLRRCARCTACGHKGATIQHPGQAGGHIGFMPYPVERQARVIRARRSAAAKMVPPPFAISGFLGATPTFKRPLKAHALAMTLTGIVKAVEIFGPIRVLGGD
jgi:hypothetical protein